jgi:carboxyl-terminal processing protease
MDRARHYPGIGRLARSALLLVTSAVVLASCGGGGGSGGSGAGSSGYPNLPASCDTATQKAWLRDYMNDQYFWYDQQGAANEAAASPAAYLDSLLYKPKDRYSYAQSTAQFTQFFDEGRRTGYGDSLVWADAARTVIKVRLIEPQSPLGLSGGMQRGDTVLSIDGYTPAQIASGQLPVVDSVGVARTYVVQTGQGPPRSLTVQSADFALSPVITQAVFSSGNAKVGYLMYQEFISSGAAALGTAFDYFRAQGVTELILDLRYNGGGSTLQARNLASMAGGSALDGQVFAHYRYSAKNAANNFSQEFTVSGLPALPLNNLNRVFAITSASTASASELVINALRPFKNVITIGSTTYGKPYAFQPRDACGTTYNAVNIEIANANGFADYSAGIAPTCVMSDDLSRPLGDPAELRTAAALSYIVTGVCPPVAVIYQENKAVAQSNVAQAATKSIVIENDRQELGFGEQGPRQARVD